MLEHRPSESVWETVRWWKHWGKRNISCVTSFFFFLSQKNKLNCRFLISFPHNVGFSHRDFTKGCGTSAFHMESLRDFSSKTAGYSCTSAVYKKQRHQSEPFVVHPLNRSEHYIVCPIMHWLEPFLREWLWRAEESHWEEGSQGRQWTTRQLPLCINLHNLPAALQK